MHLKITLVPVGEITNPYARHHFTVLYFYIYIAL